MRVPSAAETTPFQKISEFEERTAMLCAAEEGHAGTSEMLVKSGADVNAQDWMGDTRPMLAAEK